MEVSAKKERKNNTWHGARQPASRCSVHQSKRQQTGAPAGRVQPNGGTKTGRMEGSNRDDAVFSSIFRGGGGKVKNGSGWWQLEASRFTVGWLVNLNDMVLRFSSMSYEQNIRFCNIQRAFSLANF